MTNFAFKKVFQNVFLKFLCSPSPSFSRISALTFSSASIVSFVLCRTFSVKAEGLHSAKAVTTFPNNKVPYVRLFEKFASVELDGEIFMTPRDFIDSQSLWGLPSTRGRISIDQHFANKLLSKTPKMSSKEKFLFRNLDRNGLISLPEYLFLQSVLTGTMHKLRVLFQIFDRDCSDCIEKPEFLEIMRLFNMQFHSQDISSTDYSTASSTILQYLFKQNGTGKLTYDDFEKFISNLQREVLLAEFNHINAGIGSISALQLAEAILQYSQLSRSDREVGLRKVTELVKFNPDSINFSAYWEFFELLYSIDDLASALKMFLSANRSISKDEFQRAARAVTGKFIDKTIVDTVFLLFDADGDGHLSANEFLSVLRSYASRNAAAEPKTVLSLHKFTSCVGDRIRETV